MANCQTCEHRGFCKLRHQCRELDDREENGCISYKQDYYVKSFDVMEKPKKNSLRIDALEEDVTKLKSSISVIKCMLILIIATIIFFNVFMNNVYAFSRESKPGEVWTELGEYKITHYCSCRKCCGKTATTASGAPLERYKTVAMNGVPFGTLIYIDTYGYRIVQDRGPLGKKHIDVYTEDHQHALKLGTQKHKVWIVEEK